MKKIAFAMTAALAFAASCGLPPNQKIDGAVDGGSTLPTPDERTDLASTSPFGRCGEWQACSEGLACIGQQGECSGSCTGHNSRDILGRPRGAYGNPPCGGPKPAFCGPTCQVGQQPGWQDGTQRKEDCAAGLILRMWYPGDKVEVPAMTATGTVFVARSFNITASYCLPPRQ